MTCSLSPKECPHIQRVIECLHFRQQLDVIDDQNCDALLVYLSEGNDGRLLDDWNHVLFAHLGDQMTNTQSQQQFELIYAQLMKFASFKECTLEACTAFKRNSRNREKVLFGDDSELSFYVDLLDDIHCHLVHSFDCGFRPRMSDIYQEEDEMKSNDDDGDSDARLDNIGEKLLYNAALQRSIKRAGQARHRLDKIRPPSMAKYSKFVTTIVNDDDDIDVDANVKNEAEDNEDDDEKKLIFTQAATMPSLKKPQWHQHDVSEWLCELFYNQADFGRLKQDVLQYLLGAAIDADKLRRGGPAVLSVIDNPLMNERLAQKIYDQLLRQNIRNLVTEVLTILDSWWDEKRSFLYKKCNTLEMNKGVFVQRFQSAQSQQTELKFLRSLVCDHEEKNDMDIGVDDFESIVRTVRLCLANDITTFDTLGEWLVRLFDDEQELQIKLQQLTEYVVHEDINAHNLMQMNSDDFYKHCEQFDIPHSVSIRMHNELLVCAHEDSYWSSASVAQYMHCYLQHAALAKRLDIMRKLQETELGKRKFVGEYLYKGNNDDMNDFLHLLFEKNESVKQLQQQRIWLCIAFYTNMFTQPAQEFASHLPAFELEKELYHTVVWHIEEQMSTLVRLLGYSNGRVMRGSFDRDIRFFIAEMLLSRGRGIKDVIESVSSVVLTEKWSSSKLLDFFELSSWPVNLMEDKCGIPESIFEALIDKLKQSGELSPPDLLAFTAGHLYGAMEVFRTKIYMAYPVWKGERKFIDQVILQPHKLHYLLIRVLLAASIETFLWYEKSYKKIVQEAEKRRKSIHVISKPLNQQKPDFPSWVADIVFGSVEIVQRNQQAVREWIFEEQVEAVSVDFSEFVQKLTALTTFPVERCLKLHNKIELRKLSGDALCDVICAEVVKDRSERRDILIRAMERVNVTKDSWTNQGWMRVKVFLEDIEL